MKIKKAFPILLSFLAIASVASTAVLGNTQIAYAGGVIGCNIDPDMVDAGILDIGDRFVVLKTVTCSEDIIAVDIDDSDCVAKGIAVRLGDFGINNGEWEGEEVIDNIPGASGKITCTVEFQVEFIQDFVNLFQTIMATTPETVPVGGEFSPIDSTALLLAAAQSPSAWLSSLALVALGIGAYVFTRNPSNMRNIKVILRDYLDRI